MRFTLWLAMGLAVLATGCVQAPKKQAFNREGAAAIKTVAVTQGTKKEFYEAGMLGHPGASFGLIGGLIAAADTQSKSNRLTQAIKPEETKLQERFTEKLKTTLAQAGYETSVMPLPAEVSEQQLLELVKKSATDTVLTLSVDGKYLAAGPTSDYFPYVLVKARLLETKSSKVLFEDTFTYGFTLPNAQTVHTPSDAKYRFANIDALVADPNVTRQGLLDGLDLITNQIATDLKKN